MTAFISVDHGSKVPLYRQIADRVCAGVAAGRLAPGQRLPTVRRLAQELGVTRVTVQNAFKLLQEQKMVESTVGRGTFIAAQPPSQPSPVAAGLGWKYEPIQALTGPSLAFSEPDSGLQVEQEFLALHRELGDGRGSLLHYGPIGGAHSLREEIAQMLMQRGVPADPERVLITQGSTMALNALVRQLTRGGDRVLVEERSYFGMLAILRANNVEPVAVPMDERGLMPDALERAILRERPRLLYTIPTFHNPTGITMDPVRRQELMEIANRYGLLIVEDDVFHLLGLDADPPQPLAANAVHREVIYVDSFSKSLLPGLRLGYMLLPEPLRPELEAQLETSTLSNPLTYQRSLAQFLRRGLFARHLERVKPVYRQRRERLQQALQKHMPAGSRWTQPEGGYCCWLSLPEEGMEERASEQLSRELGLPPSRVFDARSRSTNGLRLCFGNAPAGQIERAVRRLGEILSGAQHEGPNHPARPRTRPWV